LTILPTFSTDENNQLSVDNNHTHGAVLFQSNKVVGIATYINVVNETCSNGTNAAVPVYRTIVYQDSSALTNEQLPAGDPDSNITVSTRISFFSFLTDCPKPSIYWDPEIGTNGATSIVSSLLLIVFMLLTYLI